MAMLKRRSDSRSWSQHNPSVPDSAGGLLVFARERGIATQPLDVEGLITALGLEIRYEPLDPDISGKLANGGRHYIVVVNALHHPNRQRFTLAHELGHYILHRNKNNDFVDRVFFRDDTRSPMEVEANQFAASILMPEDVFRDFSRNISSKVEDLAENFGVSSLAVRYRAKQLGYAGHGL